MYLSSIVQINLYQRYKPSYYNDLLKPRKEQIVNEASKLDDLDEMLRDDELMGGMTSDTDGGDGRRPRFIFEDYFGNVEQNWKNILKYKIEHDQTQEA